MIEELRAQIEAVRRKLALAEQADLSYEAELHRARLADLMDIAARHAINLTGPDRSPGGAHPGRDEGHPESGTTPVAEPLAGMASPPTPERALVYARVNTIFGTKDRVEAGIAQIEGRDRAVVEATSGNRGLTTMIDQEAAVIIAISYWDEPERSSEAELTRARQNVVAAAGGDLVAESYVLALADRASMPAPGSVVRLVRVQMATSHTAGGTGYLRDEVLPRLRATAGFHHGEVLVDHELGNALLVSAWRDEEHAARGDAVLDRLRPDALHHAHLSFPGTETYTLVRDAFDIHITAGT